MICHPCERAKPCKLDTTESLLLLQGTGLRWYIIGWLLLRSELSLIAMYLLSDVLSLEWSNLHLSNRFTWKDDASMKLHCIYSLVVEGTRQLSLSTRPAFHSFDTLITPTHHSVEWSWSLRYSIQQGVFRVDRSIPDVLKWTEYSYFSSLPPKPLLFSHSTTHPSISYLLFGLHTHSLTSIQSLHHSFNTHNTSSRPYPHT